MTAVTTPARCVFCGTLLAAVDQVEMGDGTVACADQAACHEREMEAKGLR